MKDKIYIIVDKNGYIKTLKNPEKLQYKQIALGIEIDLDDKLFEYPLLKIDFAGTTDELLKTSLTSTSPIKIQEALIKAGFDTRITYRVIKDGE